MEKVHAVAAQSTFRSQNQFGPLLEIEMLKSVMPRSKCAKHLSARPLLEIEMLKKCTLLWRKAHFEVKTREAPQCQTTFGN